MGIAHSNSAAKFETDIDELIDRAIESRKVLEDPDASKADFFEDVVRLELLAPEPVLIGENQSGEWSSRVKRAPEAS